MALLLNPGFMSNKNLTIASIVAAVIAIVIAIILLLSNGKLKNSLDQEKLTSENLLSEKLALQKSAEKNEKEISTLNETLASMKATLSETEKNLAEKENSVKRLTADNAKLKKISKEIEDLKKDKTILTNKIADLEKELQAQKMQAADMMKKMEALTAENSALKNDVQNLTTFRADNYVTAAFKGKADKLTLKATRTKKITINFEVPVMLANSVEFKVFAPSGKEIFKNSKELSWRIIDEPRTLTASLSPAMGSIIETSKVELVYKPASKLETGIYKIELHSNSHYLGSCRIRLK